MPTKIDAEPHLHFSREEFAERKARVLSAMQEEDLDGLLIFKQESMFYLTGFDSFGFVFFQCLYLHGDGSMVLLTRAPDLRQAQLTSIIEDIRVWVDAPDANPAADLKKILEEKGAAKGKLGVEYATQGLTAANGRILDAELGDYCRLVDSSRLVDRLRMVKSPAELACARRAGELADAALAEAERLAVPGAFEGDILAAMHGAIFRGGGDYPGNEFILGSGDMALLCRSYVGRRNLSSQDQLTIEFAGAYLHYHAAMMRTIVIGKEDARQREMHRTAVDALHECAANLKPGRTFGDVFDAYASVADEAGLKESRLNATGYSLGAKYYPTWMEEPVMYSGNPQPVLPGMVLFVHIILMDSASKTAMCTGHTFEITQGDPVPLSKASLDLVVNC